MSGKVEIEVSRAWSGCRWCWDVWSESEFLCRGVEDTFGEALEAVRKATELRAKLTESGVEWTASRYSSARHAEHTKWTTASGSHAKYTEYDDGQTVMVVEARNLTPEQAIAATLGAPINEATGKPFDFNKLAGRLSGDKNATLGSDKPFSDAIANLRKTVREAFSGESVSMLVEGHAIMRAIDAVEAATLGSEREKRLEKLVRIYGEMANYFCERFACCDAEFANCKYCIGLPQSGQCELGWCNDESKALGIEQPDYGGGECEPVNLQELYDRIGELENGLAEHGTLTAEQVNEVVKRHASFDYGEIGAYVSGENWETIANELNAMMRKAVQR